MEEVNGLAGLYFFLSLSGKANYTSVCFQLSTQNNVNVNVIGESGWLVGWIGCFFTHPSTKVRYLSPLFYFHTFCYRDSLSLSLLGGDDADLWPGMKKDPPSRRDQGWTVFDGSTRTRREKKPTSPVRILRPSPL